MIDRLLIPLIAILLMIGCKPKATETENSTAVDLAEREEFFQDSVSREQWLSKNYEESIVQISDTNRVVFRLNWWRAFHPYVIIRIENFPQQVQDSLYVEQYAVSKVYRDELNDYSSLAPRPYLFEQKNCKVSNAELEGLIALANKVNIWNVKSDKVIQTDGSNWELEIYMKGKYHLVSSNSVSPAIKEIGQEMIELSCLKLKKEEIY